MTRRARINWDGEMTLIIAFSSANVAAHVAYNFRFEDRILEGLEIAKGAALSVSTSGPKS
jgi:hypothetical protein